MKNPFKLYAENKAKAELEEKVKYEKDIKLANDKLALKTADMRAKLCPISETPCMGPDCVHFRKGWVSVFFDSYNDYWINIQPPKCRLWGKS